MADGTATLADGDHAAKSGALSFNAAQRTWTATIDVAENLKAQAGEIFGPVLSSRTNAIIVHYVGVGTIVNGETDKESL